MRCHYTPILNNLLQLDPSVNYAARPVDLSRFLQSKESYTTVDGP